MNFAWTELKQEQRAEFQARMKQEAEDFLRLKNNLQIVPVTEDRTVYRRVSHCENRA